MPPFLTETVAKAKRKRELLRIFAMCIAMCFLVANGSGATLPEASKFAFVDGSCFAFLVYLIRRVVPEIKFPSFGIALIFRSIAYTLVFVMALGLVTITVKNGGEMLQFFERRPWVFWTALIYFYLQALIVTGIRGIFRKLGPGAFWHWIRGYYYTPKTEERIFMFLDMRRSTELAEQLGDVKFSELVRDFFDDLTGPIIETRAEVSHYIGDEAVITWWPKRGLTNANCIQIFFRMQVAIDRRKDHYVKEYGLVPEFKAGAHIGSVVATEVGKLKSEIVFHGDVLNTTARVQAACSTYGADFLITEALASRLPKMTWLQMSPIGDVLLKGKTEKIQLLSASLTTK